ncbi:MAG: threonine synthase [Pseudomonadota bacterium]|nr:threonine synthase [Pseudomonadota bacterium]
MGESVKYISTRNTNESLGFNEALLTGLAPDGGLYVPMAWPTIQIEDLNSANLSYSILATQILRPFIGGDIDDPTLQDITTEAYSQFCSKEVAPLVEIGPSLWLLELFHGPTLSFKDFALQVVSRLFDHVLSRKGEHITVIGATSGDTGSAAIDACKDRQNIDLFMLHPLGRISEVQRRQMTSVHASNIHNIAVNGTFDDCQRLVKEMFGDSRFNSELSLAAVNSINWARVMVQVVYYYAAFLKLKNKLLGFSVPTGNFGNVYAGYVATRTGLPRGELLVATNQNDILHRVLTSGTYQTESVKPGISPSMDIQVASNFERYLFELQQRNSAALCKKMEALKNDGIFTITSDHLDNARTFFSSSSINEAETLREMGRVYSDTGNLIDPHTAVGTAAARKSPYKEIGPMVCLATAHPAKFSESVIKATGKKPSSPTRLLSALESKERYDTLECEISKIQSYIRQRSRRSPKT